MNTGALIIGTILFLPVLLLGFVWWLWTRRRPEGPAWRRKATFISATAATASALILLGVLGWANFFASIAPAAGHPTLFSTLTLLGFLLCVASIPAAVLGIGSFRWLVVPAALLHSFCWIIVGHIATMPMFVGQTAAIRRLLT